jgi:tetratricopeptide (TPR) repeat protein
MVKANALSDVKRYDDALASLDTAERQNPALAGQNTHSLRGRIYFRQRKIGPAYRELLAAQRASGRLLRFAPALAGLNMVLSVFGNNAPVAFAVILGVIILAILFGFSAIPAVGPWIVAALVLAIIGFFAFAGVRYTQGTLLPAGIQERLTTIAAAAAALIIIGALALFVEHAIITGVGGANAEWFTPTTLVIAGAIAFAVSALALYGWPRLLARFEGRGAARA